MSKARILLLQPSGEDPSPLDQSLGAHLAATKGHGREMINLERDGFQHGDLNDLEKTLKRWAGQIAGVVGATNVAESTCLGKLADELKILCFVSNNNPSVWQKRRSIFHIGVPTAMTSADVATQLLGNVGTKRVYLLYDPTEFQSRVATQTESFLKRGGVEVRSTPGSQSDWLDDVRLWKPDLLYLVYSEEGRARPSVVSLRDVLPDLRLLLGRSLLRETFIQSLGKTAEGLLFVDMYHRGLPRTDAEAHFVGTLSQAGISVATSNHGFGWDAMTLCNHALSESDGDANSAVEYLESGVELSGATGRYCFSAKDHNGRQAFRPTTLSILRSGRTEPYTRGGA